MRKHGRFLLLIGLECPGADVIVGHWYIEKSHLPLCRGSSAVNMLDCCPSILCAGFWMSLAAPGSAAASPPGAKIASDRRTVTSTSASTKKGSGARKVIKEETGRRSRRRFDHSQRRVSNRVRTCVYLFCDSAQPPQIYLSEKYRNITYARTYMHTYGCIQWLVGIILIRP